MSEKKYYGEDPHWKECLRKYIEAELIIGVDELIRVKNFKFGYTDFLIYLSPTRFEILLSLLRKRWKELQGLAKKRDSKEAV